MIWKAEAPSSAPSFPQFPCTHQQGCEGAASANTWAQKGSCASEHRGCREDAQCSLLCLRNKSSDTSGENAPLWPDKLKYVKTSPQQVNPKSSCTPRQIIPTNSSI